MMVPAASIIVWLSLSCLLTYVLIAFYVNLRLNYHSYYYYYPDPKKYSKQDAAFMMPNKGGGLQAIEAVDKENVSNSNRSIKLFGYSGAHLELGEQQNVYYAPREDYHQVDGNKFDMVMGNREFFTRGDCNIFAQGSLIMKGGNTSQNALQAMDSINEVVNNVNSSMSGGGSTSDGSHLA